MRLEELTKHGIPEKFVEKFKEEKITQLYPPQADIVMKGLFREKNLVISMPTAGGKTLIASLAIIDKFQKSKSKVVYIVPLVALANEKYDYYKKLFEEHKVTISVGDLDSTDSWLANYDLIICTTEKLDSLIRHGSPWIKDIGLIIVDEVHLLNDPSRGPTLEILLTRLREIVPRAQIFALSATIKNADEIAKWFKASLVLSDFRPVELHEGVAFNSKIMFYNRQGYNLSSLETDAAILEHTLHMKKQALFFVSTRRNAEKLAEDLCKVSRYNLDRNEKFHLENIAQDALNVLEVPTKQCKKLAECIKNGVAFHHAGLLGMQRRSIEQNFKKGLIKSIVATPTLALGVNLPAFRVVIRDAKRFYPGIGAVYIPVLEYKQFVGRAGRPQYDQFGESILVAKSEEDAQDLVDHFIMGEPERIQSKLAIEPVLRMHTLSLIASEFCKSEKTLFEFFSKTFYAFQYGDLSLVEEKIFSILENLAEWELITIKSDRLIATRLGKRVSELYIDPLTAHYFVECLKNTEKRKLEPFSFLQCISNTSEMRPLLSVRSAEFSEIGELISKKESSFLHEVPEEWDLEFDDFLKSVKTTLMFEDWINEATEDKILVKYHVAPGELRNRLENADWLIYSLQELATLLKKQNILREIRKTRVRMMYGIKEELVPLVRLKSIGRVRARKLFNAGLKSISDLKKAPIEKLAQIVGVKNANSVKEQLEEKPKKLLQEKQTSLKKF